jgi:DNA-binding GntR family transcriptional regulator
MQAVPPRRTAAEEAAEVLRDNIFEGRLAPGTPLPENAVAAQLQLSRNTVREAFRLLMSERLLTYEAHKGVSVRELTPDDVREIYRLRKIMELSALDALKAKEEEVRFDPAALEARLEAAEEAAERSAWRDVGTENLRFHAEIVAIHGSKRFDEFFRGLMTEMRLGYLAADQAGHEAFHGPYVVLNREIYGYMTQGHWQEAHQALKSYLRDAREAVVAAVSADQQEPQGRP